ncbi:hypothetical protein Tco_0342741, partial [Tanacetum coccineum]
MIGVTRLKKDLPILHLWFILLQVLQVLQAQTLSKSVTNVPDVATSEAKSSESKPKIVSEPLIEDWISESEDEN